MYCVKCGVELADSEKKCPLCETVVYHPDMKQAEAVKPYPSVEEVVEKVNPRGVMFVLTILFALPMLLTLLCDWQQGGGITWSGYAAGGILLAYIIAVLPFWFENPNPVIFVPSDFAAVGVYLLYIDLITGGNWFLRFALPVVGCAMLLVSTVVTLMRYVRGGYLYIFGGALILNGGLMILTEFLINHTFGVGGTFMWSLYPFTVCFLLGMMLIVVAICKPLRESLYKKLFI